jgi:Spy/CpxP family protein refolding chaperone
MLMRWIAPLAALGACFAQGPPPEGGALKAYLNLTDAQVEQMRKAGDQSRKQADEKVKALQPQLEQKRAAVRDLMAKGSSDATAVGKAVLEVQAIEKQIRKARESARTSQLAVLTPEQRTKFKAIEDAALLPQATREAMRMGLAGAPGMGRGMGLGQMMRRGMMQRGMGMRMGMMGQGMMPRRGMGRDMQNPGPPPEAGQPQGPPPNQGPGGRNMMRRGPGFRGPNGPPPAQNPDAPRPPQPPAPQEF